MICDVHGVIEQHPETQECFACMAKRDMMRALLDAADELSRASFSHVDGRDLLGELHPRRTLDIKRRKDGRETWYEGDWLSRVYTARQTLDLVIAEMTGRESRTPKRFPAALGWPEGPQHEADRNEEDKKAV